MQKLQRFLPAKWWSSFLWVFATYIVFADILPNLLLLIVNCSGYLPYSDRPGPGWQTPHLPSKDELGFFCGFAVYMAIPAAFYAIGHAVLALLYAWTSLPKWVVRVLGSLTGFLSAGLLMAGAGWMIAIAPVGVYLAAGCGLAWGLIVLPWLFRPQANTLPTLLRILIPMISVCGAVLFLIWPMLPKKPVPPITFELNRITAGEKLVTAQRTEYFLPETWAEMDELQLHGEEHGGIQSAQSGEGKSVDVLVLTLQPIDHEYKIEVPASGHVVYVLQNGTLTPHPAFAKRDSRTFSIRPGHNPEFDGGEIKMSESNSFSPFTWYPTIPRQ